MTKDTSTIVLKKAITPEQAWDTYKTATAVVTEGGFTYCEKCSVLGIDGEVITEIERCRQGPGLGCDNCEDHGRNLS